MAHLQTGTPESSGGLLHSNEDTRGASGLRRWRNDSAHLEESRRSALLQQQLVYAPDYDPSIMFTENERASRQIPQTATTADALRSSPQPMQTVAEEGYTEDLETQAIKDQIRYTTKQSIHSAGTALHYAEDAEASGRRTLRALGEQSERVSAVELSLAITANNSRIAHEETETLKTLNRSMFAIHVVNPFSSRRRLMEREQAIRTNFRQQRDVQDATRRQQYDARARAAEALSSDGRRRQATDTERRYREQMLRNRAELAERSRFLFEPDTEDFHNELVLDERLDSIAAATARLNAIAKAMSAEVEQQNCRLARIDRDTRDIEVDVHLNTARLARIR
ncbi:uncharacterized protein V1518DRAFT_412309 [Limtongia smithiae]|uniref:uncharacterized protein n=1 Tax=Limtongia smithiae TaxID=1125753 RepID=UPI0034CFAC28